MNGTSVRHRVGPESRHYAWDNSLKPCLRVASGDIVQFDAQDCSGGQITTSSTAADILSFDMATIDPVFGPVYVEGAEPGDALHVTVLEARTADWGWTANIPGFGLLADEFTAPALIICRLGSDTRASAEFLPGVHVPLRPFPGIMGVAPAAPGEHAVVPPRATGGNLDARDLVAGSTLVLPVEVPGALFSCGDGHAAQGDGELCGTAIETAMTIVVRLDVVKGTAPRWPRFVTPGPLRPQVDAAGYEATMGIATELEEAARAAAREMVDHLAATRGLSRPDAYLLCSVCADLHVSQIVDEPNVSVSLYVPRGIFA